MSSYIVLARRTQGWFGFAPTSEEPAHEIGCPAPTVHWSRKPSLGCCCTCRLVGA
jgi:hypothetical protein